MKPHQREGLERKSISPKHREKDQEKVEINWGGLRWSGFCREQRVCQRQRKRHMGGAHLIFFLRLRGR